MALANTVHLTVILQMPMMPAMTLRMINEEKRRTVWWATHVGKTTAELAMGACIAVVFVCFALTMCFFCSLSTTCVMQEDA